MFIDQEAEWQATIDNIKGIMYHPDVQPMWMQIPFKLFNASSTQEHWLRCWNLKDADKWVHPQDPISIKENVYGVDRFAKLYKAILAYHFPTESACYLAGVRTEESMTRFMGLTSHHVYKGFSAGKMLDKKRRHITFYPIYDWSYSDVWKAITSNAWPYNRLYDLQYQYGLPVLEMRVSNVHHETALKNLFYLQEAEPQTYQRIVNRLPGIDMMGKLKADFFVPDALPPAFNSWKEYRDYLFDLLITEKEWRRRFLKEFAQQEELFADTHLAEKMYRVHVNSILINDWELIKTKAFRFSPEALDIRRLKNRSYAGEAWSLSKK
jgi:predicted phosphoadenosine phosphosulfate sulfurtransferase